MTSFLFELRYAWRSIVARPGFSALAVLVLAAGLASALSIASFMNTLVLNPLPFKDSESLYRAGLIDNNDAPDTDRFDSISANDLLEWTDAFGSQATIGGYTELTLNLGSEEHSERYSGGRFSPGVLEALGVAPQLGRNFDAADSVPGAPAVVLLSEQIWRLRFASDPAIVGRQLRINAAPAVVIGVMPADFSFPMREQLWMPLPLERGSTDGCCEVILRPDAGVTEVQLRATLEGWYAEAKARDPQAMKSRAQGVGVGDLRYRFVDRETIALFAVMAVAVSLVLLIACANVANLLLGGLLARERELALRAALGAGRGRLLMGALLHSCLLALIALVIALPLAQLGVNAIVATLVVSVENGPPHWMHFAINGRLMGIAFLAALLTALLSGLLPALHASLRRNLDLRGSAQGGGGFAKISQWLMVGQVAFSLAVLMTTALLVQTVRQLGQFDLGLDTRSVLTARVGLVPDAFANDAAINQRVDALLMRLRAEPGVAAVTVSSSLPGLMGENEEVIATGAPEPANGYISPGFSAVDADFFSAMRATLVAGRVFTFGDKADSDAVMVVDQTFVEQFLPGQPAEQAIGRRFVLNPDGEVQRPVTIVGVVRPIQMDDIDDQREAAMFVPFAQSPRRFFNLLIRTQGPPMAFSERVSEIARSLDADSPLYWVRAYDDVLFEATIGQQVLSRMFSAFGVVALLLAATGLYGVIAFNVGRRRREIGIRRALGAANASVLRAVMQRTGSQVLLGLLLGVAGGIPFANLLSSKLGIVGEGQASVDVTVWLPALLVLAVAAGLAGWLPARRALRVEPNIALRYD